MNKVLFDNNKIVEAMCQFTFKPVQDNTIFGQYWDLLKPEQVYSKKENIQGVSFVIASNQQNVSPSMSNAMKFSNTSQDKIIQLHHNNLSIHQIKNYQTWENFKVDIDSAFSKFNVLSSDSHIERIDLRAINVFDFPLLNFSLSDYFNVFTNQPATIKNANTNINLEFPLEREKTFAVIRINTNLQQEKVNVVLDLSFISIETNIKSSELQKIDAILQFGHLELHKIFSSVITDKTKAIIK